MRLWLLLLLPALAMVIVGQRKQARFQVAWWLVPTALLLIAYVGYIVYVGGDWMKCFRWFNPVIDLPSKRISPVPEWQK